MQGVSDLKQLPGIADSVLVANLVDCDLSADFPDSYWQRGRAYFENALVLKTGNIRLEEDCLIFDSVVEGSRAAPYDQEICIFDDDSGAVISGDCSCPVGYNCKHVAAAVLELQRQVVDFKKSGGGKKLWLERFKALSNELEPGPAAGRKRAKKKPKSPPKTVHKLGFLLSSRADDSRLAIRLAKLRFRRASDEVLIESDHLKVRLSSPGKYLELKDQYRAWQVLEGLPKTPWAGNGYYTEAVLDHGQSLELLKDLARSGRLYLVEDPEEEDNPHPGMRWRQDLTGVVLEQKALEWGAEREMDVAWQQDQTGRWKPVLTTGDAGVKVFQVHEGSVYFDPGLQQIGELIFAEGLTPAVIDLFTNAPPLDEDEALELAMNSPKSRLIPPLGDFEIREIDDRVPVPVLELVGVASMRPEEFDIRVRLLFDYGAGEPEPFDGEADPPPIRHRRRDLETPVLEQIRRDAMLERSFWRQLTAFEDFEPGMDYLWPGAPVEEMILMTDKGELPAAALLRVREQVLPELREHGWRVEDRITTPFDLQQARAPEVRLEPEENGSDWFRFDVGLLGANDALAKVDFTQLMADYLAAFDGVPAPEELEDPEAPIFLPCHQTGTMLRLPSGPFFEVLSAVSDLLLRPHEPLHRLRAASLAETLEMDGSETLRALAKLGKGLADIGNLPLPGLPAGLRADLRPYQREGFHWMQFLARHSLHGILADDMGLGKTVQSLAHLLAEIESGASGGRPGLVVAPTSVVGNWIAEAGKFAPELRLLELQGAQRHQWFDQLAEFDLVVTSYALVNRDIEVLAEVDWHGVILDEAQHIKNPTSKISKNVCMLRAQHRLCLSGTPVENHLGELWALFRFLMPGFLGSSDVFREHFRTPIERHDDGRAREQLGRRVRPLILRRTKDQVNTELPPKTEIVHPIQLNKKQVSDYESVRLAMDAKVRQAIAAKGEARSQIIFLEALLKLRQICCDPRLLSKEADDPDATESAKLKFLLDELLPTLIEDGRRILLFSQFTRMLGFIEEGVKELGLPYLKLTGNSRNRSKIVEKFQAGEASLFLISLKAGGTGLNLTEADTVIHYDPWWNPAAENQATDRAHRIGQQKPVFVHRLICEGTIESRIQQLQQRKAKIAAAILGGNTKSMKLDRETLSALLAPIGA